MMDREEKDIHDELTRIGGGVIVSSHDLKRTDNLSVALFALMLRTMNTYTSIATLRQHSTHDEVFIVDASTLLRCMFDASVQAEFIYCEKDNRNERATLYVEYENIEKVMLTKRVMKYTNILTEGLKGSPLRAEGEKRNRNRSPALNWRS